MKRSEAVSRAMSAVGKGCRYGLGKGGFHPEADHPWAQDHLCDCSGFVAWAIGVSRRIQNVPWYSDFNGGWFETTAIARDATSPFGFFDKIEVQAAKPGDLIVYGDYTNQDGTVRQGHVGIISRVDHPGPTFAVHCSRGNEKKSGDAIQETSTGLWLAAGGIVARCALLEDG